MFWSHSTGRLQVLEGSVRWTRLLGAWRVVVVVHLTRLLFSGNSDHSLLLAGPRRTMARGRWRPGSLLQFSVSYLSVTCPSVCSVLK